MDTTLKHVLKEEFIVYHKDSSGKRQYLTTIYRNCISESTNIDDAMKLDTEEASKAAALLAATVERNKSYEFKICHIQTIAEDVDVGKEDIL